MSIELASLNIKNISDVGFDVEVSMSVFDGVLHDGVWITLEWDTSSDFSNPTKLPDSKDMGLFPDDGYASSSRRITDLPSDTEVFIRVSAESVNWQESVTYNDAFNSSGFEADYDAAGQPGSEFNVQG